MQRTVGKEGRKYRIALAHPERRILRPDEAAQYLGYEKATAAFYNRCEVLGVVPLWCGAYDRIKIDSALDQASGLAPDPNYGDVSYGSN